MKDVDEMLYLYMIDHNEKFNHYLIIDEFKLVFNDNQHCKFITTGMSDNETCIFWSNYLRDVIDNLIEEGFQFNYMAEMDFITLAHKQDMTYDFYIQHNMPALEMRLNAVINKDKNLVNHFPRDWYHPLNKKFDSYRVQ